MTNPLHQDTKHTKLLKRASLTATFAAVISLGRAFYQATTLDSIFSIFGTIIGPLASFLPALALLMIAMNDYGITTPTSRIATFLVVTGALALFLFAISMFFI